MMILQALGARESFGPLWRAHAFVLTRVIAFNSGDWRWAMAALVLRLLGVALGFAERQLARWARRVLRRAWQGVRFAAGITAADTMVAAGGR